MKEFNCVPLFHQGINELTDGIEINAPDFCLKNCTCNEKCRQHYATLLFKSDGNYQCPFGFASTVFSDSEKDRYIFTSMRLENVYSAKLADPKAKTISADQPRKNYRRISERELQNFIDYYLEYKNSVEKHRNLQIFVENIFHDMRKFNAQLKTKSYYLYRKANSEAKGCGQFMELSKTIYAISSYMTLRMDAYDFMYNEALLATTEKSGHNIYHIFDKVKHCLKDKADERSVTIHINSNGECGELKAYDCLDLLPFILLDNAIKYSDRKTHIQVEIKDTPASCIFSVSSISPRLADGECERIFDRGFRGENARKVTDEGLGIGLYTAKKICDLHNGSIEAYEKPIPNSYPGNRKDFDQNKCLFVMDIRLNKEYNI